MRIGRVCGAAIAWPAVSTRPSTLRAAGEEGADAVAQQQKGHAPARLQGGGLDQVGVDPVVAGVLGALGGHRLVEEDRDVAAVLVAAGAEAGDDLGGGDDLRRGVGDGGLAALRHGGVDAAVAVAVDLQLVAVAHPGLQFQHRPGAGRQLDAGEMQLAQHAVGARPDDAEVEVAPRPAPPGSAGRGPSCSAVTSARLARSLPVSDRAKLVAVGDLPRSSGSALRLPRRLPAGSVSRSRSGAPVVATDRWPGR